MGGESRASLRAGDVKLLIVDEVEGVLAAGSLTENADGVGY